MEAATKAPAKSRKPKYSEMEISIRDRANELAASGKPFAAPIIPAQVRRVLKAMGVSDPFAKGAPLEGMKVGEAIEVAKNGGRSISTKGVGEWKRAQPKIANDVTLDNRRIVAICVALRAEDRAQAGA